MAKRISFRLAIHPPELRQVTLTRTPKKCLDAATRGEAVEKSIDFTQKPTFRYVPWVLPKTNHFWKSYVGFVFVP